jgi:hypothetical protein
MSTNEFSPPIHPDIKRELKHSLFQLSPRSFELFAGDFLVYVGLEAVSVTRFIGDGGIDAVGDLVAGRFRIPIGIQVKRYRNNVQRPDIDRFIGALSGQFSEGMFMTTANYSPAALQKATTSLPRILTLNGDHIVSMMLEHHLGTKPSSHQSDKLDIDADYFHSFEERKALLSKRVKETSQGYNEAEQPLDEQTILLTPEEDLLSLTAFGYALRVDPTRLRRWVEQGTLQADVLQSSGEKSQLYFRRDRIERVRATLNLENIPASPEEWKQEFLDFARSRNLSRSYKPVMIKAFFQLADREGAVQIDDLVAAFKNIYQQHATTRQPLEQNSSLMTHPFEASNQAIKRLIITNPLERFLIKNFIEYDPKTGILWIAPHLWQGLHYYEVLDVLKNADEQIEYYRSRPSQET